MTASDKDVLHGLKQFIEEKKWYDVVAIMYWRSGSLKPSRTHNIRSFFDARGKCLYCDEDFRYGGKVGTHIGKCKSIGLHYRRARAASMSDLPSSAYGLDAEASNPTGPFSGPGTEWSQQQSRSGFNVFSSRPSAPHTSLSADRVPIMTDFDQYSNESTWFTTDQITDSPVVSSGHSHNSSTSTSSSDHRRTVSDMSVEMRLDSIFGHDQGFDPFLGTADTGLYYQDWHLQSK